MAKRVGDTVRPESRQSVSWGNQVRIYVLDPYTKVKDVRSGVETSNVQAVLDGDLDAFMAGMLAVKAERRL
jgi:peptide chain release factor 2